MAYKQIISLLFCTFALISCGGGGSSGTPSTVIASKAEGHYVGTLHLTSTTSADMEGIVLENGQFWFLYGSGSTVYGMMQGNGTSTNGSYSASDVRDFYYNGSAASATVSASYQTGSTLNGFVSEAGATYSFTSSIPASDEYNYNTPAVLGDVVGTWSGPHLTGGTDTLTVGSTGSFTSSNAGCVATGTILPRASGKNVFDIAMTFSTNVACGASSGLPATGVALSFVGADGFRRLLAFYITNTRTLGSVFFGIR